MAIGNLQQSKSLLPTADSKVGSENKRGARMVSMTVPRAAAAALPSRRCQGSLFSATSRRNPAGSSSRRSNPRCQAMKNWEVMQPDLYKMLESGDFVTSPPEEVLDMVEDGKAVLVVSSPPVVARKSAGSMQVFARHRLTDGSRLLPPTSLPSARLALQGREIGGRLRAGTRHQRQVCALVPAHPNSVRGERNQIRVLRPER